jgi:hypothetical protein
VDTYAGDDTNFPALVRYIEDGDAPNEANLFPSVEDLADRTAALKDGDLGIAGDKTYTGEQAFQGGAVISGPGWNWSNAPVIMQSSVHIVGSPGHDILSPGDSDQTIGQVSRVVRIRALTGTRNYWVTTTPDVDPMTGNPKQLRMMIVRAAGLTAATVDIRIGSAGGTVIAQFPADATHAWCDIMYTGATDGWRVLNCSANTAALRT